MHTTQGGCKTCFLFAFMFILLLAGCGPEYLNSAYRAREVAIDGTTDETEWGGGRFWFGGIKGTLGIMNDEEYLYLSVATSDSVLRTQIVRGGLTVWFNASGNKDQTLGIEFPMPLMVQAPAPVAEAPDEAPTLTPNVAECTIITESGDARETVAVSTLAVQGIELAVTVEGQRLVYEAKIPLKQTAAHPHAIEITDKHVVGIGFVTGTPAAPQRGGAGAGGGMAAAGGGGGARGGGGGRGGVGGAGGGGMAGGRGGMAPAAEPLNLWIAAQVTQ